MTSNSTPPSHSLRLRLRVLEPPPDVSWVVQLGRSDALAPILRTKDRLEFDVRLELIMTPGGEAKLRGPAMQGPLGGRFLYLASGTRAGDAMSPWNRRAKISLETLPLAAIRQRPVGSTVILEGEISGTAKDGGPACASVPLLGKAWRLEERTA